MIATNKIKIIFFTLLSLFFISCKEKQENAALTEHVEKKKPNILFISVDDLNNTLGYYGNTQIKSPQIDKLASQGTAFTNNHCQQALCGPSRASVLSGLRPDNGKIWELFTQVREANPAMVSLPEYFRKNGYETAGSGKVYDGSTVDAKRDSLSWSIPFIKPKGTRWLEHNETSRFEGASNENKRNVPTEAPDRPESDFLDAKETFQYANEDETVEAWPFDQAFHLKLNVAVGGSWGGEKGIDDSIFPKRMIVDYIRVYQLIIKFKLNINKVYYENYIQICGYSNPYFINFLC